MENNMTVDDGFERLQEILDRMDEEGVSLETSFQLYNDGIAIVKQLNEKLTEAEDKITIINEA